MNDSSFDAKSLYYIIGNYRLRVLVLSMQEEDPYKRMADLRPVPSAFVALGSTRKVGVRMYCSAISALLKIIQPLRHA